MQIKPAKSVTVRYTKTGDFLKIRSHWATIGAIAPLAHLVEQLICNQ